MLYLFTGLMGSSKTLSAIKFVCEDEAFKDRPVYFHRIRELTLDWEELDSEQLKDWRNLPDGSVIVVDECDHVFPTRSSRDALPDYIRELKETRTRGMDFVFITQFPAQMDIFVRRNIGHHTHLERKLGLESASSYEWSKCHADPDKKASRDEAVTSTRKFDKKYYNVYKSAESHTHRKRIPWKMLVVPFVMVVLAFAFAGWKFFDWGASEESAEFVAQNDKQQTNKQTQNFNLNPTSLNKEPELDYYEQRIPRMNDVPWSAPIYDEVVEYKSFPRPQCIFRPSDWSGRQGECKCYTQQATPLNVSLDACMGYVKNGYFQPYIEDTAIMSERRQGQGERQRAAPVRHQSRSAPRSVVIKHTARARM